MTERHNREDSMKHTLQLDLREYCDCQGHLHMAFEFQFHEGFSPLLFGPLFPQLSNGDAELSERTQALIVKGGQCCVSVGYKGYRKLLPSVLGVSYLSLCTWASALDQTSGETSSAPPSSSSSSASSTGSRPLCTGQTE